MGLGHFCGISIQELMLLSYVDFKLILLLLLDSLLSSVELSNPSAPTNFVFNSHAGRVLAIAHERTLSAPGVGRSFTDGHVDLFIFFKVASR